jgi:hypothetical protein
MGSMTTFEARVGQIADPAGSHQSVVTFSNSVVDNLPLAQCTVTLSDGEVFRVTGERLTCFFTDLEDALWFAVNNNAELMPGAIAILTPCLSYNGIPVWQVSQIHDRAVAKGQA